MLKSFRSITAMGVVLGVTMISGSALADGRDRGGDRDRDRDRDHERDPNPRAVPEISGTQAGGALTLVLGGVAVVLGRRRRKTA